MRTLFLTIILIPYLALCAPLYRVEYIVFTWPSTPQIHDDFSLKDYFFKPFRKPNNLLTPTPAPLNTLLPVYEHLLTHHLTPQLSGSTWISLPDHKAMKLTLHSDNPQFSSQLLLIKKQFIEATFSVRSYDKPAQILREHRRLKTKQLNYFDHPKLGALIWIAPPTHQQGAHIQ